MNKPVLQDGYPKLTRADVQAFESDLAIKLPDDYREFILRENGGFYRGAVALLNDKREPETDVHAFLPLVRQGSDFGVREWLEQMNTYLPEDLLPIGITSGGDTFCLLLTEDDKYGSVWIWDHELGWDKGLEYLKPSFSAFYNDIVYDTDNYWSEQDPPFVACEQGDVERLDALVRSGLNVNYRKPDGETLLMTAAGEPQPKVVEYLVDKRADLEAQDAAGGRALHYAARVGALDCARLLIEAGANVNVVDEEGWTPLINSIGYQADRLALLLIERGADVNADAGDGVTPLALCLERDSHYQQPLLESLQRAGAQR